MATLLFNSVNANGPQLAGEIRVALGFAGSPVVRYIDNQMAVEHPDISESNRTTIQSAITAHVPNLLFGVVLRPYIFTINGAGLLTWTNMPLALTAATGTQTKLPLFEASFARLTVHVTTAGTAAAVLIAQVSTDGVTYTNGPQVAVNTTGLKVSTLVSIPSQFQTDCFFRMAGSGGDGVADPAFGMITVQIA